MVAKKDVSCFLCLMQASTLTLLKQTKEIPETTKIGIELSNILLLKPGRISEEEMQLE